MTITEYPYDDAIMKTFACQTMSKACGARSPCLLVIDSRLMPNDVYYTSCAVPTDKTPRDVIFTEVKA
jgi:hypothetical protein